MILPRSVNGTPTASNSRLYQPEAMPSSSRPPAIRSRLDTSFASTPGVRRGHHSTPGAQLYLRCSRRHRAEQEEGVDDWKGRIHTQENVVPHPDRIEPQLFGFDG